MTQSKNFQLSMDRDNGMITLVLCDRWNLTLQEFYELVGALTQAQVKPVEMAMLGCSQMRLESWPHNHYSLSIGDGNEANVDAEDMTLSISFRHGGGVNLREGDGVALLTWERLNELVDALTQAQDELRKLGLGVVQQ